MRIKFIRIFSLLAVFFSLAQESIARDMSKAMPYLDAEESRFIARHEGVRDRKELEDMVDDVRSGNPVKTKIVVAKLTEMQDEEMLLLILEFFGIYERRLAATALKDVGGEKSLSKMIEVLNRENKYFSGAIRSNAEVDSVIQDLQTSLVVGIERISGVRYGKPGDYTRESVLAYLTKLETSKVGRVIDPKSAGEQAKIGSKQKATTKSETVIDPISTPPSDEKRKQKNPNYWWLLLAIPMLLIAVKFSLLRELKRGRR